MSGFNHRYLKPVILTAMAAMAVLGAFLVLAQSPALRPPPIQPAANQDLARTTWVDSSTGLRWTLHDNGSDISGDGAKNYCRSLNLGGIGGWRLPTITELEGIWRPFKESANSSLKGGIQLSEGGLQVWSATVCGDPDEAWSYDFGNSKYATNRYRECEEVRTQRYRRALCVRRAGN